MKPYSDYGPRLTRQILCDLTAVLVIAGWVRLGNWVYTQVEKLTEFGVRMEESGAGFRETMTDVADTMEGVPFIGAGIRAPFDAASRAGAELEAAGQAQQEAFTTLALALGVGVAALPIAAVLVVWLVPRLRFAIRAHATQRLARSGAGVDLFALRALLKQRPAALLAAHPDPAQAWRRRDPEGLAALAGLELKANGVRLRNPRVGPPTRALP